MILITLNSFHIYTIIIVYCTRHMVKEIKRCTLCDYIKFPAFIYLHRYFATEILIRWLKMDAELWPKHVMPSDVEEEAG